MKHKKVLFSSIEEAESQTGYFAVSSLLVSARLGEKIKAFIGENRLYTFLQPNQRKTSNNTYTLNFTLKEYHTPEAKIYLSKPGATGYYSKYAESAREADRKKYEELRERSPTLEQMYFWIVRKYPNDLIWMDYRLEPLRLDLDYDENAL